MNNQKWYATKADGMCCDTNFSIDYEGAHWSTCMAAVVDEDGETVALVVDVNDQLTTAEFNERMRLIAAAPDLLAALELLVAKNAIYHRLNDSHEWTLSKHQADGIQAAIDLIAKIKDESK